MFIQIKVMPKMDGKQQHTNPEEGEQHPKDAPE